MATSVADLLVALGRPSPSHSSEQLAALGKALEACKIVMREKMVDLANEIGDRAALLTYSGDGTPIWALRRTRLALGGEAVTRLGGKTVEFYVHNAFLITQDSFGERKACVLLDDPRPMSEGKTAVHELAFGLQLLPKLRFMGLSGIVLFQTAYDRAKFGALKTLWRRWQILEIAGCEPPEGMNRERMFDLWWHVPTACACHDVHKALQWSALLRFNDLRLLKDTWVSMAALANSSRQLLDALPSWLGEVLHFAPARDCPSEDALCSLWVALGVAPRVVEEVVALRLHVRDGALYVLDSVTEDKGGSVAQRVSWVLISIWTFARFTTSRWLSVGVACRCSVAEHLSGLGLLADAQLDSDAPKYHLNGYKRKSPEVDQFVGIIALASYPADAALRVLLEDSRLCRCADDVLAEIDHEAAFLTNLPESVWVAVGSVSRFTGSEMRSESLEAAHLSVAFMWYRIFSQVRSLPFSLCVGDIAENLDRLMDGDEPSESVAGKIWSLLRSGFTKQRIIAALELMRELRWDTGVAEQQHASATMVAKFHPQVEEKGLMARASAHSFKRLLPAADTMSKMKQKLRARLEVLENMMPHKVGAWHAHCGEAVKKASSLKAGGMRLQPRYQQDVFRVTSNLYKRRSEEMLETLEGRARVRAAERAREIEDEVLAIESQLALLQEREREEASTTSMVSLAECKWSEADLRRIQAVSETSACSGPETQRRRLAACTAPDPPTAAQLRSMKELPVSFGIAGDEERPAWVEVVAKHREQFRNSVFIFREPTRAHYYKLCFCVKRPTAEAWFSLLEQLPEGASGSDGGGHDPAAASFAWSFRVSWSNFCSWRGLPAVDVCNVRVVRGCTWGTGSTIASDALDRPLPEVLLSLPPPLAQDKAVDASAAQQSRPRDSKGAPSGLSWVEKIFIDDSDDEPRAKKTRLSSKRPPQKKAPSLPLALDDEGLEALLTDFQKATEVLNAGDLGVPGWRVRPLGGRWTAAKKGEAFDNMHCAPRANSAELRWAVRNGMGGERRWSVTKYGVAAAHLMASTYANKGQWFFDQQANKGVTGATAYEPYLEPPEFAELEHSLDARQLPAFFKIREWFPTEPF